jgi:osmotically-inducible protein OsmY
VNDKERIEAAAARRLRASSYLGLRQITCTFRDGVLTLAGQVSSYFLRQMARALVRDLDGVEAIDDRLVVVVALPTSGGANAGE